MNEFMMRPLLLGVMEPRPSARTVKSSAVIVDRSLSSKNLMHLRMWNIFMRIVSLFNPFLINTFSQSSNLMAVVSVFM